MPSWKAWVETMRSIKRGGGAQVLKVRAACFVRANICNQYKSLHDKNIKRRHGLNYHRRSGINEIKIVPVGYLFRQVWYLRVREKNSTLKNAFASG